MQIGYFFNLISMGMLLSVLMILAGAIIYLKKMTSNKNFFNDSKKLIPVDKFIEKFYIIKNWLLSKKFLLVNLVIL